MTSFRPYFDFQGVLGRNISTLFRPFRPSKWFNFGFMYSPAYVVADLKQAGITNNMKEAVVELMMQASSMFREHIWIPRCTEQLECERRLGITKEDKRQYKSSSTSTN